jgi:hypothetical protein
MFFYYSRSNTQLVTKNEITGDSIQSKGPSKAYLDNYDKIFGKKNKDEVSQDPIREGQPVSPENNSKQKEEKSP